MQRPGDGHWKQGLLGRLAFYAVGLAIGFIMLGFFQAAKRKEAADRERARQQHGVPAPPVTPEPVPEKPRTGP
jgi:hypothetical protein